MIRPHEDVQDVRRPRTRQRDDDHLDVYWCCTKPNCTYFSLTPKARDEHQQGCHGEPCPVTG